MTLKGPVLNDEHTMDICILLALFDNWSINYGVRMGIITPILGEVNILC